MLRPALAALLLLTAVPLAAQPANPPIDFTGFRALAGEVEPYRQTRLIDWETFAALAALPDVLILDARSESAFRAGHIAGAVNLPLPDFTAESLARLIGRPDRPILIYCNNNFSNDAAPVPLKRVQLALNIQTFINLVGYGYRNVRELNDVIDFDDPAIPWVSG
jgi:phage shock protein E